MKAPTVYNMDYDETFDRTKQDHPLGKFDLDFRDPTAENPLARRWTYGFTFKTLKTAVKHALSLPAELHRSTVKTRVVDAETGEVVWPQSAR